MKDDNKMDGDDIKDDNDAVAEDDDEDDDVRAPTVLA